MHVPLSISPRLIHSRSVADTQPIFSAIDLTAVLAFLQQVNYAPTDFGGEFGSIAHSSILSKVGAFAKPEEIILHIVRRFCCPTLCYFTGVMLTGQLGAV